MNLTRAASLDIAVSSIARRLAPVSRLSRYYRNKETLFAALTNFKMNMSAYAEQNTNFGI
jgi:hypothetical protein